MNNSRNLGESLNLYSGDGMVQSFQLNDYIAVPDCATRGTVKDIKTGGRDTISPDPMPIYEIEPPLRGPMKHGNARSTRDITARASNRSS